jgi:hypothetical protein
VHVVAGEEGQQGDSREEQRETARVEQV